MPKGTGRPANKDEKKRGGELAIQMMSVREARRALGRTLEKNELERQRLYKDLGIDDEMEKKARRLYPKTKYK